jgi:ribosomal protein L37AE/L43A
MRRVTSPVAGCCLGKRRMKTVDFLLGKFVAPFAVAVLTPAGISVVSKLRTGDWLKLFGRVPTAVWIAGVALLVAWYTVVAIRKRLKRLRDARGPFGFVVSTPIWGWLQVGKLEHAGVCWIIRAASPPPWTPCEPHQISPASLEVETPPRCPRCETELEGSERFWGGHLWKCIDCGFERKNSDSYYLESERAERMARRHWERSFHEHREES